MKGEYAPDKQGKVLGIEELYVGDAPLRDDRDLRAEYVDKANQDERIRDERGRAQLREVADKYERQEDEDLHANQVLYRNQF